MSMYRNDRTAEDIRREITAVIRELKDPRVKDKLLTVVRIELAGDEKDEINELADSVNNMLNEVSATDKIKNDFITTVSHELRTPLTSIKNSLDILMSGRCGEFIEYNSS